MCNKFIGTILKDLEKGNKSTDNVVAVSELRKFHYHTQIRQHTAITYRCLNCGPALWNNSTNRQNMQIITRMKKILIKCKCDDYITFLNSRARHVKMQYTKRIPN